MEAQTFSPQLGDLYTLMAVCGALFLTLLFVAYRLGKVTHPDPRRRVLLPMLAYFLALLALMGLLGAFWSSRKYPDLIVRGRQVTVDGQTFPAPAPAEMRLENYESGGLGPSTRVLLLQTPDRVTHAFPADRYPVNEIMGLLRAARER